MKPSIEKLDYIFLLRPTLFYPIWTFFLAGVWGGQRFGHGVADLTHTTGFFWVSAALSLVVGGVFILNQIKDTETDRINGKLFLIANGLVPIRHAAVEAALFSITGLVLGAWIDYRIGVILAALFTLSGYCYNFEPFSWKARPILGILTNVIGGVFIYSLGWISGGGHGLMPLRVLAYAAAGGSVFLNTTLPDIEGDRQTGKITFGVRYGVSHSALWSLILEGITVLLALIFRDWLLFFPAIAVMPFFVIGLARKTIPDVLRATKLSVLALVAGVCILFPWYLVPVVLVFFFSKWYYKRRFDFDYPSFRNA